LDPCPKATIETSNTINNRAIPLFMTFSLALFVIPVILLEKLQLIQSIEALLRAVKINMHYLFLSNPVII
jgi:hypothetical protein